MYKSIVVGTDGSETSERALAEAIRVAKAMGGDLHVVSAYEPLRGVKIAGAAQGAAKVWEVRPDTKVQGIVERAVAIVKASGVGVQSHALTGDPADALLEIAAEEKADLIVVGNRGMHGVTRVLGSVPNKVSHRASCHVLIVATDQPDG